jgi:hypothetical protein
MAIICNNVHFHFVSINCHFLVASNTEIIEGDLEEDDLA